MHKHIYTCDCCGKNIKGGDYDLESGGRIPEWMIGSLAGDFMYKDFKYEIKTKGLINIFGRGWGKRKIKKELEYYSFELCFNCYVKISKMIIGFIKGNKR